MFLVLKYPNLYSFLCLIRQHVFLLRMTGTAKKFWVFTKLHGKSHTRKRIVHFDENKLRFLKLK